MGLLYCTKTQATDYDDWDGSDPSAIAASSANATWTETNTVFLYNVGKKMFLNRGGSWGTEAVLSNVGMEFLVYKSGSSYYFVSNMKGENGTPYLGAATGSDGGNYFVDQTQLAFTATSTTVDGKTCYQLMASSNYMCGAKNSSSSTADDISSTAVNSFSSSEVSAFTGDNVNCDKWIFVTVEEREKKFAQADIDKKVEVPATFLMTDNDFARRSDTDVKEWKTDASGTLTNSYTTSTPPTSNSSTTYYVGNGGQDSNNAQSGTLGGKWTANIHGASGGFYQELSKTNSNGLFRQGWYQITCHAFSTTSTGNAYLYAIVGDAKSKTRAKSNYSTSAIQKGISAPSTYIAANDEVNKSETIDGESVYDYLVSVRVYVEKASGATADEATGKVDCESLKFGVKMENGASSDWLCVDNFEIKYIGEGGNEVVLDENQTSVDYMNNQINKANDGSYSPVNSTIYLNRSLTAGVWNSLLLPFDMDANDITTAFGSGTIVSKYVGAKDNGDANTIYFEKTTTIQGGKLYIIKPTVDEPDNGQVEALSSILDGEDGTTKLSLTGKYYTIPNIVYGKINEQTVTSGFTATVEDKDSKNNVHTGAGVYYPAGTYVKKQGNKQTQEGYAAPEGSYMVLAANKQTDHTGSTGTWALRTVKTSSLGFRAWIQPETPSSDAKATPLSFVINGVGDETTAIDGMTASQLHTPATQGIYTLSGQRIGNDASQLGTLPKGIYVVNGKKMVIK